MGRRRPRLIATGHIRSLSRRPNAGIRRSVHRRFCLDLSVCERHHSVLREDQWWIVYRFADAEHAEKFRIRFGGERFDPKDRGRSASWARWYKTGR
jgi:hypothetical protein